MKLAHSSYLINDSIKIDKTNQLMGVDLSTGKKSTFRFYRGDIKKEFLTSVDHVANAILDYQNRCNNKFKEKRKYLDKNKNCPYYVDHLVESVIHPLKDKIDQETEAFIVTYYINKRGRYIQNDLVKVYKNDVDNKKNIKIVQQMIDDQQLKKLIPGIKDLNDNIFQDQVVEYLIEEVNGKAILNYRYEMKTNHWLVNKIISVPEVFENMSETIGQFMSALGEQTKSSAEIKAPPSL